MKKAFLLAGLGLGVAVLTVGSIVYASGSNYTSWRSSALSNGGRAVSVVNEKNFDQFNKMHQLMVDGKYDEAQKIRTELGLGNGNGKASGGCAMHNGEGNRGANFVDINKNGVCDRME
ncbi:MAG: hypothetical protein WCL61_03825 [bacterium]